MNYLFCKILIIIIYHSRRKTSIPYRRFQNSKSPMKTLSASVANPFFTETIEGRFEDFIFQSLELLKSFSIKILKLKKNTSLYGVEIERIRA